MKKWLIVLLLCIFYLSHAQQVKFVSDNFHGVEKQMINSNKYYLPLDDNEFLFAGGKGNSNDVTLIKLNKDCKTLWSIPRIDDYLSASILGKDILVFSANNSDIHGYKAISKVHATLINNQTGAVITEKDIPTYSGKAVTDIYVLTDSADNFKYLILRSTKEERGLMITVKTNRDFGYTENLQAISFGNNLNINATTLEANDMQNKQFVGCTCNANNDIFLASIDNTAITVSRYDAGSSKISASIDAKTIFENNLDILYNDMELHENKIWLTCKVDESKNSHNYLINATFDFNTKKGFIKQDLMDKDYMKQYDKKNGDINILGTEFYKNNFIVIKEAYWFDTRMGMSPHTDYGPVIVSVYNSEMKPLKEIDLNASFSEFYILGSTYFKLLNNQLFVFYNKTKLSGVRTKYQVINLDNFNLSDEKEITIDARLNIILFAPGIVWFNNTALLPYAEQNNMLNPNKIETNFRSVDF